MGSIVHVVCTVAVRSVLVPAGLAFAWLLCGAAVAEASPLDTGRGGTTGSVYAAGASGAASELTAMSGKSLLPARAVPGIPDLTAPVTTTVSTLTGTTGTVAGATDATLDAVTGAVLRETAVVVTTVTTTAAPVLTEVDQVIGLVEGAVRSVPPVISVPVVPLPPVPVPQPGVTVPGIDPGGGVSTPAAASPRASPASAGQAHAAPPLGAGTKSEGSPLPRASAGQPVNAAGQSLAQLQMTTPHRPETAGAVQGAPVDLPHATPHHEPLASLAEGPSGSSSSGSEGSGVQAGDVAGSWSGMHLHAGARTQDANQTAPASPAFDPGSSPD